jgi:hypothetical protein
MLAAGYTLGVASTAQFNRRADLELGIDAYNLGFETDGEVDVKLGLDLRLELFYNNETGDFEFSIPKFETDASISTTDLVATARAGSLVGSIGHASGLKGQVDVQFHGNVTWDATNGFAYDLSYDSPDTPGVTEVSRLDMELPFYVEAFGVSLVDPSAPSSDVPKLLGAGELFTDVAADKVKFTPQGFQEAIGNFANIGPRELFAALQEVKGWLGDVSNAQFLNLEVPFTGQTLGELFDFGDTLQTTLIDKLNFDGYETFEELANAMLDGNFLNATTDFIFDGTTKTLTIPFNFNVDVPVVESYILDLGLEFGENNPYGFDSESVIDVGLKAEGGFNIVLELGDPVNGVPFRFFIEDATIKGEADITSAAQIDANLGFISLSSGNGTGLSLDAEFEAALDEDGNLGTTDDRKIEISRLFSEGFRDKFAFDYGGSASATLQGLTVDSGFGGFTIAEDEPISITIPDLKQPTKAVAALGELGDLLDFKNLSFSDIVGVVRSALNEVESSLQDTTVWNTKIPVINETVADLFPFVDDFLGRLEVLAAENPDSGLTIQVVESIVETFFDLHPDDFALTYDQGNLDVFFHLRQDWGGFGEDGRKNFAFNLDVQAIKDITGNSNSALLEMVTELADTLNPVGGGKILMDGYVDVVIDAGIDLTTLGQAGGPDIYIRDYNETTGEGTKADVGIKFTGQSLELGFEVAPFTIAVTDGSVVFDGDGSTDGANDDFAVFSVFIDQQGGANDDGKFKIGDESIANNFGFDFDGDFSMDLPLTVGIKHNDPQNPEKGKPIAAPQNIQLSTNPNFGGDALLEMFNRLSDPSASFSGDPLVFTFPNFQTLLNLLGGDLTIVGLLNNPRIITDGVSVALDIVESVFTSQLAADIPLIGDKLQHAGQILTDFRAELLDEILEDIGSSEPILMLQTAIYNAFGPDGLGILKDRIDDADTEVTLEDVVVIWTDEDNNEVKIWDKGDSRPGGATGIQLDVEVGGTLADLGVPLPFDFEIPGMSLDIDGDLGLEVEWSWDFGLGLNDEEGFYLATNRGPNAEPELKLEARAFL